MNLIRVKEALKKSSNHASVTLIAVSKMQPKELIKEAYDLGQRDFGENYAQELIEKAQVLKDCCPEIRWHFIGALQSNKINQLVKNVPGLVAIQTVDSLSKFEKISKAFSDHEIDLFIQVNVSGEESKHGLTSKEDVTQIYRRYLELKSITRCRLVGLMMIGEPDASERDFNRMIQLRRELEGVEVGWVGCKISMGMSGDFELAAAMGGDVVRVGSAIFGERRH